MKVTIIDKLGVEQYSMNLYKYKIQKVYKSNHGSRRNMICKDRMIYLNDKGYAFYRSIMNNQTILVAIRPVTNNIWILKNNLYKRYF